VIIGTTGVVKGEIFADKLVISGLLEGNANCENIEILAGGKILGDITVSDLVIESKGVFEGTSRIKVHEAPRTISPSTDETA